MTNSHHDDDDNDYDDISPNCDNDDCDNNDYDDFSPNCDDPPINHPISPGKVVSVIKDSGLSATSTFA